MDSVYLVLLSEQVVFCSDGQHLKVLLSPSTRAVSDDSY